MRNLTIGGNTVDQGVQKTRNWLNGAGRLMRNVCHVVAVRASQETKIPARTKNQARIHPRKSLDQGGHVLALEVSAVPVQGLDAHTREAGGGQDQDLGLEAPDLGGGQDLVLEGVQGQGLGVGHQ